ncbi:hypothetical protein AGABI2DRAFT_152018 [Agaricus bisporus var. bisporus H97]|uniref:hypothetical protein n=1 Tax=Agaricus bisporus var. bisporus (strain H97 / ATCC MYA-4626 / FGSC 10389) TaxID=936046 RepID=UPI00029F726D|nr:hypothetical protein AGABI2DRAFT_152018 [Agaricus bisporus var. bisporus H97]EKV45759.1 hypothetical protein AGABI2DRAFT_152018 [Agaricus bisporus var. bisporus H97]
MFSFRRKPKKSEETSPIRTSPSLPDLKTVQGSIPWPEDLVDVAAIRRFDAEDEANSLMATTEESSHGGGGGTTANGRPSVASTNRVQGATRISFSAGRDPVKFHKPFFRPTTVPTPGSSSTVGAGGVDDTKAPISSFYMAMATPAEALNQMRKKRYEKKEKSEHSVGSKIGQRRAKIPPAFNIMVAGSKGTGKSSLLRLLLETADISPTATKEQRVALDKILDDLTKPTNTIQRASIEISESRFDRILLSVIDTPGLEFQEGRELKLERQVNAILRHVDAQYADTMNEESKVIRQQKGDQHVHLCIYMIDPTSITSETRRTVQIGSGLTKTRSETTISHPPELVPDTCSGDDSDEDEDEGPLTMAPAEIKVIRRISNRSNVLPVIAHADSLTDEMLEAVKEAVRKGMADAGIDFGVFGSAKPAEERTSKRSAKFAHGMTNGSVNGHAENGDSALKAEDIQEEEEGDDDDEDEEEEERISRPVIKLRPSRHRAPSRSRSRRRELSRVAEDDRRPMSPDATDLDSVANVRFSAHVIAKDDIGSLLPFALITPENKKHRRPKAASAVDSPLTPGAAVPQSVASTEGGHDDQAESVMSPVSVASTQGDSPTSKQTFLQGPPADMKGKFVRRFRWGTVDVLDPKHCDFAAMRTAILSTHLRVLKIHTREVLYEKYRTEKLLARRATRNISDEDRLKLLEGLGL